MPGQQSMLSGANSGRGGPALGKHLSKAAANEAIRVLPTRHLGSESIRDQIEELTDRSSHATSARTIYHIHIDPPLGWDDRDEVYEDFLQRFENEFGLRDHARAGVEHVKTGEAGQRHHRHYAWDLARDDGTVVRLSHDYARRERCAVETAHRYGMPCPPLAHARSVHAALRQAGHHNIAAYVQASGELDRDRRAATTTPRDRLIEERTGVPLAEVRAAAYQAWQSSDNGPALRAALAERGLILAQGTKAAVAIDRAGTPHRLTGIVSGGAKLAGATVRAAQVHDRIAGLDLPVYTEAKAALRDAAPQPAAPAAAPTAAPLTPRQQRAAARAAERAAVRECSRQGRDTSRAGARAARQAAELAEAEAVEIAEPPKPTEQQPAPAKPEAQPQAEAQPRPAIEAMGAQGNPMRVEPPAMGSDFSGPVSEAVRLLHPNAIGHEPQPVRTQPEASKPVPAQTRPTATPARPAPARPTPAQAARAKDSGDRQGSSSQGSTGQGSTTAIKPPAPPRPQRPVEPPQPAAPEPSGWLGQLAARIGSWVRPKAQPPKAAPPVATPAPTAPTVPDVDAPGWQPRPWWDDVTTRANAHGRGEAPAPVQRAAPQPTKMPANEIPDTAVLLTTRRVSQRDIQAAQQRFERIFRHAGLPNPKAAALELIQRRNAGEARNWNAATEAAFPDARARANQLRALQQRRIDLDALRERVEGIKPAVAHVDRLWERYCERQHKDLTTKVNTDLADVRERLAKAHQDEDTKALRQWRSAESILLNERHRLMHRLRAEQDGGAWRMVYADAAEAPRLLAEIKARQLEAIRQERERLDRALEESAPGRRQQPMGPNAAGYQPTPAPGATNTYQPR